MPACRLQLAAPNSVRITALLAIDPAPVVIKFALTTEFVQMAFSKHDMTAVSHSLQSTDSAVNKFLDTPTSNAARLEALAAARTLVLQLQNGDDAFLHQYEQLGSAYALRTMLSLGVLKAMPETGPITAADLATRLDSEPGLIIRMMRLLVATGVFAETDSDTYTHTRHSRVYLDPGHAAFHEIMVDDVCSITWKKLPEFFVSQKEFLARTETSSDNGLRLW